MPQTPGQTCLFPSYFTYFCVLVLVASSLPAQLSHLVKVLLLSLIALAHCAMNVFVVGTALDQEERGSRDWARWVLQCGMPKRLKYTCFPLLSMILP